MIKKFKLFINETLKDSNTRIITEYQLLHLNKKEKIDYFEGRLFEFENSDFNDNNIYNGYNENGSDVEYYPFKEYEFDLCPLNILKRYIDLCIKYGLGIPYECLDSLNNNLKIKFLDSCAKNARRGYIRLHVLKLFSDKQMYVYITNLVKKRNYITKIEIIYLSDKFKKIFLDKCIDFNKCYLPSAFFSVIEDDSEYNNYKSYYINKCLEKGAELAEYDILDLSDEQKLIYYTKQVEKGKVSKIHNFKTGETKEIDLNKDDLEKIKNKK